ncbi:MAG: CpsD/CapB family tyrosine-protein kinase [Clostridiales bacterium]|nr:CpsD/CapB family tyrosine-protein kinase [Clostridiales bacterium]
MVKKKDNSPASDLSVEQKSMIGPHLNFAASEAYKLLRTNLLFSFPAEEKCHVIGITSSFQGEGKSMTAINLSYTLAEANNRVLLIEGDMRIPNFSNRLNLKKTPGLSNLLAGLDSISDAIQRIAFRRSSNPEPVKFDVITAGNIPPNPSELMQSQRMQQLIDTLKEFYDVIILDLPPLNVVTDALVASNYVSGVAVVVRSEHASKRGLSNTMRQLRLVNAKVIGFIYTNADSQKKKYYKGYGKGYSKYYSKYYQKEYRA